MTSLVKKTDLSLLVLWGGALIIICVMVSLWAPIRKMNKDIQTAENAVQSGRTIFMEEILLDESSLRLPGKTSLMNTLLKDIGSNDMPEELKDPKKIYEQVVEQKMRKARRNSGGFSIKPTPR